MSEKPPLTYQEAGVDPEKAGKLIHQFSDYLKTRPRDPGLLSGIGPFASCYRLKPLLLQYEDPILVTCCDGVGTKAKLALDWNRLDGLGHDLVAMNVNDLLCTGAKPILFLDYYACGKLDENQMLTLLKSIQEGCELAGCSLAGGETAEMPGLYAGRDFDLAGFSVGVVEREAVLGADRVEANDVLIALASSGLHSNGYSLVRKILEREKINPNDTPPFSSQPWRDVVLSPTTIYVSALRSLLTSVHAAAHITGGGLFENLPRVIPSHLQAVIDATKWELPPLFQWLQEKAGLSTTELLSTFNAGVGMIVALDSRSSTDAINQLEAQGIRAWEIGEVRPRPTGDSAAVLWQ